MGAEERDEPPIGEMFGRLIDDGKAYARAEANLVRARAETQVDRLKRPLVFGAVAAVFAIGGMIALAMTLVLWFGELLGWLPGGLAATLIIFAIAGLFAFFANRAWSRGA
ncbi:phage holin family protein [Sphingomonas sp. ASV193]|uniref:phage holin family protein n=1 Tax=Sphingomonas sp. ASV193 TaxID=3144405 RepID=UPI0032E8D358